MEGSRKLKDKYAGVVFFALGITCFLLAGLLVYLFSGKFVDTPSGVKAGPALSLSRREEIPAETSPPEPVRASVVEEPLPESKMWVLYITGEIVVPGVYSLPPESRVFQLVEAAGGLTPKADPILINMASPLADGIHVHVPAVGSPGPVQQSPPEERIFSSPSSSSSSMTFPGSSPSAFTISRGGNGGRINVNNASAAELEKIPGVGPAIARAILEYRRSHGRFSSPEDLLNVKGIGAKKLESMRSVIAVQ